MKNIILILALLFPFNNALQAADTVQNKPDIKQQVYDAELAFAQSMANRDLETFKTFISTEAIFAPGQFALRGKEAVINQWKIFFEKPAAPFSWKPETVEVLESGSLALSTGPVYDQSGKLVSTFTSIWRLEQDGKWRVIFDKGNKVCDNQETDKKSN